MKFSEKYGPWAVVAGSAEGLGEAYSTALARRNMNLVMVDHQKDLMQHLAAKLEADYGIQTICLHLDLNDKDVTQSIINSIKNLDCRLLIYNAAYSIIKPFIHHTKDELDHFININTRSQLHLVHAFSKYLIAGKNEGGILLMSSLAGLIGMQLVTPYAASKAFAWNLAEALHHELASHKIDVMACIAGVIATPAYLDTHPEYGRIKPKIMKPEEVAEAALKKLGHKTLFIPGFSNRMNYFILTRLLPRRMAASLANKTMAGMYKNKV